MKPAEYLHQSAQASRQAQEAFVSKNTDGLILAAQWMADCFKSGGKVILFGNGGSAADAQHMAAELVGRMLVERKPLPAIALTTDTSNLTAIGNDYGYEKVFERQVEALACAGDFVLAISTSGNSPNVLRAVDAAKARGCRTVALTGGTGGALAERVDLNLCVSEGGNSSRIQETHIFAIHSLVDLVDRFHL